MNEQSAIISAFEMLCGEGKPAALATVVAVSGSAYRRPGAKMLMAEDGRTWGGISGGCLERDVVRRSRGVLASGKHLLCRYETTDDDDLAAGVATGCRGTVDLFIEPLSRETPGPIPWMIQASRGRRRVALATVVRTSSHGEGVQPGARLAWDGTGAVDGQITNAAVRNFCHEVLSEAGVEELPTLIQFRADGASTDVFLERLLPPQELVIFGGGPDVVPVVSIARLMGWRVAVVGMRPATGLAQRFAHADVLHVTSPEDPLAGVEVTRESAVVLMTHNYPRDIGILAALPVTPRYLGILGPRARTEQLFAELSLRGHLVSPSGAMGAMGKRTRLPDAARSNHGQAGTLAHGTRSAMAKLSVVGSASRTMMRGVGETVRSADPTRLNERENVASETARSADPARSAPGRRGADDIERNDIHAPIGLDLGAETPEEIALSIVAEIQAVLRSTRGGFLGDRDGPIHAVPDGERIRDHGGERVWREVACPM